MLISKLLLTASSILTAHCYPFLMHYLFVFYGSQTRIYENFPSCWQHRTGRQKSVYLSKLGDQITEFLFCFITAAQQPGIIQKPAQSFSSLDSPIAVKRGLGRRNHSSCCNNMPFHCLSVIETLVLDADLDFLSGFPQLWSLWGPHWILLCLGFSALQVQYKYCLSLVGRVLSGASSSCSTDNQMKKTHRRYLIFNTKQACNAFGAFLD